MVSGVVNLVKRFDFFNVLKYTRYYLKKYDLRGRNIIFSPNFDFKNTTFGNNIYMGNKVVLKDSAINNHSYIGDNSKLVNTKIGKFCSIGPNVRIGLGVHPIDFVSIHPAFYSVNKPFKVFSDANYVEEYESVNIGNDVWIGENVIIPSGVKIKNGAVLATGAVVTKDVEAYSIVGGVPARHIKYRFSEDMIDEIQATKWWDWSDDVLEDNYKSFHDVESFMNLVRTKNELDD